MFPWLTAELIMLFRTLFLAVFALVGLPVHADNANCPINLDFTKRYLASDESVRLCDAYADQVLLVVNTASYCGFTSQFAGLEALQEKYGDRGFSVLGFPSNDFFQDPRSEEKIREFCDLTYEVKFPMFEKSRVAKRSAEPLYQALAAGLANSPVGTSTNIFLTVRARWWAVLAHRLPQTTQTSSAR